MKRIYIMEDDPVASAMEKDRYRQNGYEVRECDGSMFAKELGLPYRLYVLEVIPADKPVEVQMETDLLDFGSLKINRRSHSVFLRGKKIRLRVKEYDILVFLAEHPNEVIDKERLYRAVWNENMVGSDATVTEHIRRIRSKIEVSGEPRHIETIWRRGYRFCA